MTKGNFDLRGPLAYIAPSTCSYTEWLQVGMALSHEGYPCSVWEEWSRDDPSRYHEEECARKWQSFREDASTIVTGATITQMAKDRGWTPKAKAQGPDRALNWDDEISTDVQIIDRHYLEAEKEIKEPDSWDQIGDMIAYLNAIFLPDDIVAVSMQSYEKDGRYVPSAGTYQLTAGHFVEQLKKYKLKAQKDEMSTNDAIGYAMGDYDPNAGAWIRFNPFDGQGVKNINVADYRYALVESDSMAPGLQEELVRKMELPVAALVFSGKKSIHAIVHIDAANLAEYKERVQKLYDICKHNGLMVDDNDRNPSRLSRLPGVYRNGHKQFLMATNIGKKNYAEWLEWVESLNDDLPDPESLASVWDDMPDLAPTLIDNVLRMGHKMLLAGPSKAGKSFALIEMCIAIAEGTKWLQTFQCRQGNVLYCNLELDRPSCLHRFRDVYEALALPPQNVGNIDIWNLRGKAIPMDQLAPKLIRRAAKKNYTAVVIDPIYKVITGDENSADQMAHFCNQFDKIASELHSAVIYCHHHSKGGQGMKRSIDRSSGSGVFARDPDAILDMIPLVVLDSKKTPYDEEADRAAGVRSKPTAFRISGTLREFPAFEPVNVWFRYPIHVPDEAGFLNMAMEEGSLADIQAKGREAGNLVKKAKKESRVTQVDTAYEALSIGDEPVTVKAMAEYFDVSERTVKSYIEQNGKYKCGEGKVYRNE